MRPNEGTCEVASVTKSAVPMRRLSEVLIASITALARTGEVEAACRLAGQACVALRSADPVIARRFDALLHRLTPMLKW